MNNIIMIISIILDGIFNYYYSNSIFSSLFTIVSLIYIYNENKKYYAMAFVYGLIYDLFYTNFYILNPILFLIVSYIITLYYKKFKCNFLDTFILNILVIIIYLLLLTIIFSITSYAKITFNEFIFILSRFMIINIFYGIILYLIVIKSNNKHKLY